MSIGTVRLHYMLHASPKRVYKTFSNAELWSWPSTCHLTVSCASLISSKT